MTNGRHIRITHKPSGEVIAEGPLGWSIMPFEGSYYIRRRCLKTSGFKVNFIPGFCIYKFLYVWLNFSWPGGMFINIFDSLVSPEIPEAKIVIFWSLTV